MTPRQRGDQYRSYEFAGQMFYSEREALVAAWYQFLTAEGLHSLQTALAFAREGVETNLSDADKDWQWPGEPRLADHEAALELAAESIRQEMEGELEDDDIPD